MNYPQDRWKRTLRLLSAALIVSLMINIFFIGSYVYFKLRHLDLALPRIAYNVIEGHQIAPIGNLDIYREFNQLKTDTLARHLQDDRWAEDGIRVRDIALGVLVKERFFDLEKALGYMPQFREISLGEVKIPIFPALTAAQFNALALFGEKERWPMTPHGMFIVLQKFPDPDPSLVEAFMLTVPFQNIARLLPKADNKQLLGMLLEGDWPLSLQGAGNGIELLLKYIDHNSAKGAELLLLLYPHFAYKKLDDERTLKVLQLLKERNPATAKYAVNILTSQRGEQVKAAAMQRLNSFSDKAAFLSGLVPPKKEAVQPPFNPTRSYVVQPGDSLWKIAKKQKVSLERLKSTNRLTDDTVLQPGNILTIPSY